MTPAQWQMVPRIIGALTTETALTERQLAARLRVSAIELKPVLGMLIGRRRVERCWTGTDSYLVLAPAPPLDEGAA